MPPRVHWTWPSVCWTRRTRTCSPTSVRRSAASGAASPTAAVTLETNLGPLRDEGLEGIVRTDVDRADRLVARADALLGRVRAAVAG